MIQIWLWVTTYIHYYKINIIKKKIYSLKLINSSSEKWYWNNLLKVRMAMLFIYSIQIHFYQVFINRAMNYQRHFMYINSWIKMWKLHVIYESLKCLLMKNNRILCLTSDPLLWTVLLPVCFVFYTFILFCFIQKSFGKMGFKLHCCVVKSHLNCSWVLKY